jgi:hypothetical protein
MENGGNRPHTVKAARGSDWQVMAALWETVFTRWSLPSHAVPLSPHTSPSYRLGMGLELDCVRPQTVFSGTPRLSGGVDGQ